MSATLCDWLRGGGAAVTGAAGHGGGAVDALVARAAQRAPTPIALPAPPSLGVCVVTCMDARIRLFELLGLRYGEAHLVRTAGALPTPAVLDAIAISQGKGGTREVMVIHHTDCVALGQLAPGQDPADTVADAVARIRADHRIPHRDQVRGFVLDLATGTLSET
ncbi:MAG: carbonic anhydrase [Actinomycetota bacterium]